MKTVGVMLEIQKLIHVIRGRKVMLDRDLAHLYGVETFNLNKAVRRNTDRFPADFMFRMTVEEYAALRFQSGILKRGQHAKYLPYAFTQEGVAMLSSVLRSRRAAQVNAEIMRAFVSFQNLIFDRRRLAQRLDQLESHVAEHDAQIHAVFDVIRELVELPARKKKSIGFRTPD